MATNVTCDYCSKSQKTNDFDGLEINIIVVDCSDKTQRFLKSEESKNAHFCTECIKDKYKVGYIISNIVEQFLPKKEETSITPALVDEKEIPF